ncbi:lysoplasmalogenase [Agromyces sp. SYSU K20354]|uniref:lysoplasmalogenase n=1 Tax=Agromyces cavernae TaxID=2898659 RepID=UPI001E5B31BC|nr:lysoplasmalogenase [Agromyces cavernae]MCD2443823.1 lysoplasmalogenase [Agromyces cavernae]
MTDRQLRPFLPFLAISLVQLVVLYSGPGWAVTTSKALLMPLLAAAVVLSVRRPRPPQVWLLVAALACSWVGDVLLSFPGWFVPGLLAFLVAHVAFIVLFLRLPVRPGAGRPAGRSGAHRVPAWALVYVAWYVAFLALLGPHLGVLLVPVAVYGAVLGTMAVLAGGRGGVIAVGGALFVVSDSVLALGRFLPGYEFALHDFAVMSTYLAAQGLIAWGVLADLHDGRGAAARSSPALDRRADATGR